MLHNFKLHGRHIVVAPYRAKGRDASARNVSLPTIAPKVASAGEAVAVVMNLSKNATWMYDPFMRIILLLKRNVVFKEASAASILEAHDLLIFVGATGISKMCCRSAARCSSWTSLEWSELHLCTSRHTQTLSGHKHPFATVRFWVALLTSCRCVLHGSNLAPVTCHLAPSPFNSEGPLCII
jgi:hypothetical protein